jgi:hypothetical protein
LDFAACGIFAASEERETAVDYEICLARRGAQIGRTRRKLELIIRKGLNSEYRETEVFGEKRRVDHTDFYGHAVRALDAIPDLQLKGYAAKRKEQIPLYHRRELYAHQEAGTADSSSHPTRCGTRVFDQS